MKLLIYISLFSAFIKISEAAIQIYIRKIETIKALVTDEDRANPDYSDPCLEAQSEFCTYCCILSKGECSRDIRACDPILVDNRDFENFYILIGGLLGVVCGCPLLT